MFRKLRSFFSRNPSMSDDKLTRLYRIAMKSRNPTAIRAVLHKINEVWGDGDTYHKLMRHFAAVQGLSVNALIVKFSVPYLLSDFERQQNEAIMEELYGSVEEEDDIDMEVFGE